MRSSNEIYICFCLCCSFCWVQKSSSNTGDVEVDFIADSSRELISDKWANDEQKKKYEPLTKYSDDECKNKMAEASKRFMSNPKAQEHLSDEEKQAFVILKAKPQGYEQAAGLMGVAFCQVLAKLRNTTA